MDISFLTRPYLETLSSADLISIGDECGIDIPASLDRNFIIGELLEAVEELRREEGASLMQEAEPPKGRGSLPQSYNETGIWVVQRNPVWAFVFWDISETDMERLRKDEDFGTLEISASVHGEDDSGEAKTFDVQVGISDREQFVLLPAGKKSVSVCLAARFSSGRKEVLCESGCVPLPHIFHKLVSSYPASIESMDEILRLSGKEQLLKSHFESHRHSFS